MASPLKFILIPLTLSVVLFEGHSTILPESHQGQQPVMKTVGSYGVGPLPSGISKVDPEDIPNNKPNHAPDERVATQKPTEAQSKTETAVQTSDISKSSAVPSAEPSQEIGGAIDDQESLPDIVAIKPLPPVGKDKEVETGDKTTSSAFVTEIEKPNVPAVKQETVTEGALNSISKIVETSKALKPGVELNFPTEGPQRDSMDKWVDLLLNPSILGPAKSGNPFAQLQDSDSEEEEVEVAKPKIPCERVTCTPPDFPSSCETRRVSLTINPNCPLSSLSGCCPLWFCTNPDGTVLTHYGLARSPEHQGVGNEPGKQQLNQRSDPLTFMDGSRKAHTTVNTIPNLPFGSGEDEFDFPEVMNKLTRATPSKTLEFGNLPQLGFPDLKIFKKFWKPNPKFQVQDSFSKKQPFDREEEGALKKSPRLKFITHQTMETIYKFEPTSVSTQEDSALPLFSPEGSEYPGHRIILNHKNHNSNGKSSFDKGMTKFSHRPVHFISIRPLSFSPRNNLFQPKHEPFTQSRILMFGEPQQQSHNYGEFPIPGQMIFPSNPPASDRDDNDISPARSSSVMLDYPPPKNTRVQSKGSLPRNELTPLFSMMFGKSLEKPNFYATARQGAPSILNKPSPLVFFTRMNIPLGVNNFKQSPPLNERPFTSFGKLADNDDNSFNEIEDKFKRQARRISFGRRSRS